jgi:hypothetical protein
MGPREREEAHNQAIRRVAEEDESGTGTTKQVARASTRSVRIIASSCRRGADRFCTAPDNPEPGIVVFLQRSVVAGVYTVGARLPEDGGTRRHRPNYRTDKTSPRTPFLFFSHASGNLTNFVQCLAW